MLPIFTHSRGLVYHGDSLEVLRELPEASAHCCVTSPPYWGLRDYGTAQWEGGEVDCPHTNLHGAQGKTGDRAGRAFTGAQNFYRGVCAKCGARRVDQQLGLEKTPEEYIARMVDVFREVRRVLRDDATLWLNIGDSYCSDGGRDRKPITLPGDHVPSGWTNRAAPHRVHAVRKGKDCDPKRGHAALGQPLHVCTASNLKPKDLVGIPWMLAFALRADGWYLRSEIIWAKPNPMPESVTDRPTKAHEQIFLLAKSPRYYYDADAIAEETQGHPNRRPTGWADKGDHSAIDWSIKRKGLNRVHGNIPGRSDGGSACNDPDQNNRNKRSVWTVTSAPFPEAHFATFPPKLIEPCILAGCPADGVVLDPFGGAGTTALVAKENGRRFVSIELSAEYCAMQAKRLAQEVLPLA